MEYPASMELQWLFWARTVFATHDYFCNPRKHENWFEVYLAATNLWNDIKATFMHEEGVYSSIKPDGHMMYS